MSKRDQEILDEGHGGYNVVIRFDHRWFKVDKPEHEVEPPLDDAVFHHPYMKRLAARGVDFQPVWAVPLRKGEVSTEGMPRLSYVFWNEERDQEEAVIIRDAQQFARWVEVMSRTTKR